MALIVEDGTGRADAESPNSVAELDEYHDKQGNAAWSTRTTPQKEVAARRASAWQAASWEKRLSGYRATETQALPYPRLSAWKGTGQRIPSNQVPVEWKASHAELALVATTGPLAATVQAGGEYKRVQIGPIEVERDAGAASIPKKYAQAELAVSPLFTPFTGYLPRG